MDTIVETPMIAAERPPRREPVNFDLPVALLSGWMLGGGALDAWAHHNVPSLETFFTPWHGVLYSGLLAMVTFFAVALLGNRARGYAWQQVVPAGYALSLLGVLLFGMGGVGDMIWHILFGIEVGVEALLSPTHLLLAFGIGLIVSGPLRAAWQRPDTVADWRWPRRFTALLSLAFTLSALTFFTEYANAFSQPWAAPERQTTPVELGQMLGINGVLVQTLLLSGVALLAVRRRLLPTGGLTFVLTINAALTVLPHEEFRFIPVALLGGLAGDLLVYWLRPSATRVGALRLFAAILPMVLFGLYFTALAITGGIRWSVPLWTGALVLSGGAGWLLSFLLVPPATVADRAPAGQ